MFPAPSDLPRWREALYAVCGRPSSAISWLEPVWHGEPETCRVVLYQVIPPWGASPLFWAPEQYRRTVTLMDRMAPDPRYRVSLNPEALSWRQWQLYERFGCVARPFWFVQGSTGGHKRQFNQVEQRLLRGLGLPDTPPGLGDLPFAPLDRRVLDQLAKLDEMRMWSKARELFERRPEDFDADEQAALQRGSVKLTEWLGEQVAHAIDDVTTYRRKVADWFPAGVTDDGPDLDQIEADIAAEYSPSS